MASPTLGARLDYAALPNERTMHTNARARAHIACRRTRRIVLTATRCAVLPVRTPGHAQTNKQTSRSLPTTHQLLERALLKERLREGKQEVELAAHTHQAAGRQAGVVEADHSPTPQVSLHCARPPPKKHGVYWLLTILGGLMRTILPMNGHE